MLKGPGPKDMKHVYSIVHEIYKQKGYVEDCVGVYKRAQKAKQLLKEQLTPLQDQIAQSPNNEILLSTHSNFLKGFTATGANKSTGTNKGGYIQGKEFGNCELYPWKV